MKTIYIILVISAMSLFQLTAKASGQDYLYKKYSSLGADSLLSLGRSFVKQGKKEDAMACFSIVSSRYDKSMGRKEKEQCIEALLDNWIVCFYFYYDVSKQFELLDKARSIGNEIGYEPSSLWLNYGVMYQTIYEQTRHREYANKAIDAYRKAYTLSLNDKKYGGNNIDIIVTNIIMVSALANNLNSINDIINLYLKTDIKGQEPFVKPYNVETFNALKQTREHKLDKAMKHIDNAIGSVPAGQNYYRYRHVALFNKVKVLMAMHKYHEAISLAGQLYAMAEQLDMKDAKIEIYETLANCHNSIGNEGMALKYNIKRYQLKDSILNFQHAAQVSESKFINRINSLEAMQQETMKSKRRQATAFAVVMCITIMIAIFSITLYRKNKKLKLGNRALYDKNIEMLKADNDNMQRLKALKEKIALLENSATIHDPAPNAANASVKFTPSKLSTGTIDDVAERIAKVMEENTIILNADFSVQTLADIIGVKYKTVSEVIHEKFECNFNAYVNSYRIKEACKRINSNAYAKYSMEGIMLGVGFKSRATFIAAFKKFTGLKPSEYQKIAKEKQSADR